MEHLKQVEQMLAEVNENAEKFYNKGNKSAATRARVGAQQIINTLKEFRKDIIDKKNQG